MEREDYDEGLVSDRERAMEAAADQRHDDVMAAKAKAAAEAEAKADYAFTHPQRRQVTVAPPKPESVSPQVERANGYNRAALANGSGTLMDADGNIRNAYGKMTGYRLDANGNPVPDGSGATPKPGEYGTSASERMRKLMDGGVTYAGLAHAGLTGAGAWEDALKADNAEKLAKARAYSDRMLQIQQQGEAKTRQQAARRTLAAGDAFRAALAGLNAKAEVGENGSVLGADGSPIDPRVRVSRNKQTGKIEHIYLMSRADPGVLQSANDRRRENGGTGAFGAIMAYREIDENGNALKDADGRDKPPMIAVQDRAGGKPGEQNANFRHLELGYVADQMLRAHENLGESGDEWKTSIIERLGGWDPRGWGKTLKQDGRQDWRSQLGFAKIGLDEKRLRMQENRQVMSELQGRLKSYSDILDKMRESPEYDPDDPNTKARESSIQKAIESITNRMIEMDGGSRGSAGESGDRTGETSAPKNPVTGKPIAENVEVPTATKDEVSGAQKELQNRKTRTQKTTPAQTIPANNQADGRSRVQNDDDEYRAFYEKERMKHEFNDATDEKSVEQEIRARFNVEKRRRDRTRAIMAMTPEEERTFSNGDDEVKNAIIQSVLNRLDGVGK